MTSSKSGFPFRLFALAFAVSVAATLIGAALSWQIYQHMVEMGKKHITMTNSIGRIMLLDEALTMSARFAVATGDMSHERRHDRLDPQLTAEIDGVRALLPQGEIVAFLSETDAANTALVKMERQAFAMAHQHKLQEATALLASDEYSRLKDAYAGGIGKTIDAVDALIASENRRVQIFLLSSVAASGLSLLFFVLMWLLAVRSAKSWVRERDRAEEALKRHQQLLAETERVGAVGGWQFNIDTREQTWTDEVHRIHEVDIGHTPTVEKGIDFYTPASRPIIQQAVERAIEHGEDFDVELEIVTAKGNLRSVHAIGKADLERRRVYGFFQDITERKRIEEQVRQLALHDTLTNLPNRRLLNDRLNQAMAASKRSGRYGAMMFLDLDNFKLLNDAYGHDVGDLLLIEAAERLKSCVRDVDTVARFGGDEFVVMISELGTEESESAVQAGIIAEKIRAAIAKPYVFDLERDGKAQTTVQHQCTASIGAMLFGKDDVSKDDVLKRADTAMYQAKGEGSNLIRFYDPKIE